VKKIPNHSEEKVKHVRTKILRSAFENVVTFALPAFGALFLIKRYDIGSPYIYIIFASTFIFSWFIVIMRMKKLHTEVLAMEALLKKKKLSGESEKQKKD